MFSALIFLSVFLIVCVRIRRSFFEVFGGLSHLFFAGFAVFLDGLKSNTLSTSRQNGFNTGSSKKHTIRLKKV